MELPREGGVETLAGFVLMRLGIFPRLEKALSSRARRLTVVRWMGGGSPKIRVEPVEEDLPAQR